MPEIDLAERHERERRGREVEVRRDRRQHVARSRAGDRQPGQPEPEHLEPDDPVGRQVVHGTSASGGPRPAAIRTGGTRRASDARATVNSPTIRPASLSIAVSVIRPGCRHPLR